MGIFILAGLMLIAFAGYRVYLYKKQRKIEEMASDAQAYVSSEIVELLQLLKTAIANNNGELTPQLVSIQNKINFLTENLFCHTDSEASVRDYLVAARQDISVMSFKLKKIVAGEVVEEPIITPEPENNTAVINEFDALK